VIWLIGNKGMLGTQADLGLSAAGIEHVGSDRELSILDSGAMEAFVRGKKLSWIVNCAAYTAVEKAEDEVELCTRLNAEGPGNVARLANAIGAGILHISTDYVFDGSGSRPYREDDPVAPIGVYGRSKAEGEAAVRAVCPHNVILRTAWLYGEHGGNFVYTMLRLMKTKERIGVVADQRGTPTWALDLAAAIAAIISASTPRYGTYHYTNEGETSWHEFALEIQRLGRTYGILDHDCVMNPLTTAQFPTKVRRPAYSVLSKDAIKAAFGMAIPEWRTSLESFFKENRERMGSRL